MTTALIVAGVVLVVLVLLVLLVRTKYGKVYSDAHLIEVCEAADRIRDHGCARPEWDDDLPAPASIEDTLADLRNVETAGGLRLRYTVIAPRANPERQRHCVSMSQADRLPAEAMTRFFVGLLLVRYGVSPSVVTVARSQNLVTHLMWELPAAERLHFAAAEQEIPGTRELIALRKAAAAAGRAIHLQRPDAPQPGAD